MSNKKIAKHEYDSNTKGYNDIFSQSFWKKYSLVAVLNAVVGALYLILFILSLSGYADTQTAYVFSAVFAIICILSSSACFKILPIWAKLLRRYRHLETIITNNYENLDPITRSEKQDKKRREDFANFVSISNQSQKSNKEYLEKIILDNARAQEKKSAELADSIKDLTNLMSTLTENLIAVNENAFRINSQEESESVSVDVGKADENDDAASDSYQEGTMNDVRMEFDELERANNDFVEQSSDEFPSEEDEEDENSIYD